MTKSFAQKLLDRPLACRWIICPTPRGTGRTSALLGDIIGDTAIVTSDPAALRSKQYAKPWIVRVEDCKYR